MSGMGLPGGVELHIVEAIYILTVTSGSECLIFTAFLPSFFFHFAVQNGKIAYYLGMLHML